MGPSTAMIGCKPGYDARPLLELAQWVLSPPATVHLVSAVRVGKEGDEAQRLEQARTALEPLAKELEQAGFSASVHVDLVLVSPGGDLLRAATEHGADLIVIGLAKRSRVGKVLMGSEAQHVLLGASCPILCANIDVGQG